MKINITSNISTISTKLMAKPTLINSALKRVIRKSALLVERHAKMRSPVDTGRLRSSIRTMINELTATVNPTVDYAIFVHDGTRNMSGRPFMSQGVKDATDEIRAVFNREIKGIL